MLFHVIADSASLSNGTSFAVSVGHTALNSADIGLIYVHVKPLSGVG